MSKPITTLMQKEMSRKEFMTTMMFGFASVLGFSTVIRMFTGKSIDTHLGQHTQTGKSNGYGGGAYGA